LLGLVIFQIFAIVFARIYFFGHANGVAKIVGQIIRVRDYRLMVDVLEQARLDHFKSIQFSSPIDHLTFTLPESVAILPVKSAWETLSTDQIEIVSVSVNSSEGQSTLTFNYNRFIFVPYAFAVWLVVSAFAFVPVAVMRRRLVAQFNEDLRNRLDAEIKEKQVELAQLVSHDIRSPLSALNMVLASKGDFTEEKREISKKAVRRINDIANNLLQSNKPKFFKQRAAEETPNRLLLRPVLETIVQEKAFQFSARTNISIRMNLQNIESIFVIAEEADLSRVLSNILNNAIEAIQADGEITIDSSSTSNEVYIEIRDTGRGIPKEHLHHIGRKGYSFGKAGDESGSGLGLYQVYRVIERFGGSVTIHSEVGSGTTVALTLQKAH
jgi:signal transduction histidine kinase